MAAPFKTSRAVDFSLQAAINPPAAAPASIGIAITGNEAPIVPTIAALKAALKTKPVAMPAIMLPGRDAISWAAFRNALAIPPRVSGDDCGCALETEPPLPCLKYWAGSNVTVFARASAEITASLYRGVSRNPLRLLRSMRPSSGWPEGFSSLLMNDFES